MTCRASRQLRRQTIPRARLTSSRPTDMLIAGL